MKLYAHVTIDNSDPSDPLTSVTASAFDYSFEENTTVYFISDAIQEAFAEDWLETNLSEDVKSLVIEMIGDRYIRKVLARTSSAVENANRHRRHAGSLAELPETDRNLYLDFENFISQRLDEILDDNMQVAA